MPISRPKVEGNVQPVSPDARAGKALKRRGVAVKCTLVVRLCARLGRILRMVRAGTTMDGCRLPRLCDDATGNAHASGPFGHIVQHHRVGAHLGVRAQANRAQDLGARTHIDVAAQRRRPARPTTQRGLLKQQAVGYWAPTAVDAWCTCCKAVDECS